MTETARDRILARLRSAPREEAPRPPEPAIGTAPELSGRIDQLTTRLEAMRAVVRRTTAALWLEALIALLRERGWSTLLYAPETPLGAAIENAWAQDGDGLPALVAYAEPIESFKERLFTVEAAITSTAGAVADTGALILRPDGREPRLMSLVPPVHVAVLQAQSIFATLEDAMRAGGWAADMPTNMVLVSGPSKTADIELTLAFGVHGPKELIVLIVE
ncbi:MAG: lactate utilization protein [Desulfobacterales bacterium]|jgi:L-lactate dehydrogenase complex protein LldG|nr:lactate utilization protein [Desulfobacterales bacterium]MCU0562102.1 lactate utilization protein [Desulfobacterales bacterium]